MIVVGLGGEVGVCLKADLLQQLLATPKQTSSTVVFTCRVTFVMLDNFVCFSTEL